MKTTTGPIEQSGSDKKSGQDIFLLLATVLFILVCTVSAFLYFQNRALSASIEINKNDVVAYTASIEKIKSDKKIISAEVVTNNKSEILRSIEMSEAQRYIDELLSVSKKYTMNFSGFTYGNGKVTTSAVAIPETVLAWDDGVKKISRLVSDYRTGTGLLFQLSPVLSVSGYEQKRAFSIEFTVANVPQK